jgi:hypothetical protein
MTIYVLIQCTRKKSLDFTKDLTWDSKTTLHSWETAWKKQKIKIQAEKLYIGRSIIRELGIISSMNDVQGYVISAGAGLVRIGTKIPAYESTFGNEKGPDYPQWHNLPLGGLSKLNVKKGDVVVTFASPGYHRCIKSDPEFEKLASNFVVANTSPLSSHQGVTSVKIHPRTAELLKIAYLDLNAELLNHYLSGGISRLDAIYRECEELPPMNQRKKITDEDLLVLIESFDSLSSIANTVRYIRHTLGISASYERIREIIYQLR